MLVGDFVKKICMDRANKQFWSQNILVLSLSLPQLSCVLQGRFFGFKETPDALNITIKVFFFHAF